MKFAKQSTRHFLPLDWEADVPTIPKYTAIREHNGCPPHRAQWPPTTQSRLPRKNLSVWTTRPPPNSTPPCQTTRSANQNPMADYQVKGTFPKESHPRRISWPSTGDRQHPKDPLVTSPLFSLDPRMARKGILGQKPHPRQDPQVKRYKQHIIPCIHYALIIL